MAPLLRRIRRLAAKIETTPGDAITLSATDAAFIVYDAEFTPDIDFAERPAGGTFSHRAGVPGARGGTARFTIELTPDAGAGAVTINAPKMQITNIPPAEREGIDLDELNFQCNASSNTASDELTIAFAGTAPLWASTFLPACGFVASANTYSPVAEAPGTNVKTLTMSLYENGRIKKILGAVGSFVIRLVNGQAAAVEFNFRGAWQPPVDGAILTPTYPTAAPKQFRSATVDVILGSVTWEPVLSDISIDAGNVIALRPEPRHASGFLAGCITSRRITGTMNPEALLIATEDVYGNWIGRVEKELNIVLP